MLRLYVGVLLFTFMTLPAEAENTWHFPSPISANAFVTKHHLNFAVKVDRETGGKLKIVVHPGGSLFKAADIFRAVRTGQVPIGSTGLFMHATEDPVFALTNMPFLVTHIEDVKKLIELSRPAVESALKGKNLKLIYRAIWTPHGLFSTKALRSPEDLVGMRIRSYDKATTRIVQLAKGIPTKTENSEIAMAFSTGVVDASFGSGVTGVSQKLWDYIGYYYKINYAIPTSSVFANLDAWNSLDADTQSTVLRIAAETEKAAWSEVLVMEETYNAAMREAGIKVLDVTPELGMHFDEIGHQIASEWLQRAGAEGEMILQNLRKP